MAKTRVRDHWEAEPCGTRDLPRQNQAAFFAQLERERYSVEPHIPPFARFAEARGKRVLEIGTGAGTDFVNWGRHGAQAVGIDLTLSGAALTRTRLRLEGLSTFVCVADAEHLPFADKAFDIVYSYGVLHHTPDTEGAIHEVSRVLKPRGSARIMLYHLRSITAVLLWAVHCAARLRPWKSPRWAVARFLESPGTKAFTVEEVRRMFSTFSDVSIRRQIGPGDLLLMRPSVKYQTWWARLVWRLYPRRLVRIAGNRFGFDLLIEAQR